MIVRNELQGLLLGRVVMRVSVIEFTLETEPEQLRDAARRRVFAAGVDSAGCIQPRSIRKEH